MAKTKKTGSKPSVKVGDLKANKDPKGGALPLKYGSTIKVDSATKQGAALNKFSYTASKIK